MWNKFAFLWIVFADLCKRAEAEEWYCFDFQQYKEDGYTVEDRIAVTVEMNFRHIKIDHGLLEVMLHNDLYVFLHNFCRITEWVRKVRQNVHGRSFLKMKKES